MKKYFACIVEHSMSADKFLGKTIYVAYDKRQKKS
jgi:hypothetical protein